MPTKALMKRPFDLLIVAFFVSHIIITIFVDSQAVLPRRWYSDSARHLLDWYLGAFGDPLMKEPPPWFKVLCWSELVLQLPFFFVGAYAFAAGKRWIQKPAIVYGISTATTLLPILGELLLSPAKGFNRPVLVAFYLPYLVLPLVLAARMLHMEEPFPQRARKLVSRKRV